MLIPLVTISLIKYPMRSNDTSCIFLNHRASIVSYFIFENLLFIKFIVSTINNMYHYFCEIFKIIAFQSVFVMKIKHKIWCAIFFQIYEILQSWTFCIGAHLILSYNETDIFSCRILDAKYSIYTFKILCKIKKIARKHRNSKETKRKKLRVLGRKLQENKKYA